MKPQNKPTYEVLKIKSKDSIALFYTRYGQKLLNYAMHTWKMDQDNASDIVYQCLYKTIDTFEKYDFKSEAKFSAFVFTIFINSLRNYYRTCKKRSEYLEIVSYEDIERECKYKKEDVPAEENSELQTPKNLRIMQQELDKLEDWERMLLLLRAQEMPYSEIAKYIDKPENQLKVYFQRLKAKIAENMEAQTSLKKVCHG